MVAKPYEIIREGTEVTLLIHYERDPKVPSIEDDKTCFSRVIEYLAKVGNVTKIVFVQRRDYEYGYAQTQMLMEIAKIYSRLIKQEDLLSLDKLGVDITYRRVFAAKYSMVQRIIFTQLKEDPIGTYVELKRLMREQRIAMKKSLDQKFLEAEKKFLSILEYLYDLLDKTRMITLAKPYLVGYKVGDRSIYQKFFSAYIKPDFMFTKLMASYPDDGEELATYKVDETKVTIFSLPDTIQPLYHILPPEFTLPEDKYEILDTARRIIAEHKPKRSEFIDPERLREVFYHIGHDLIEELAEYRQVKLREKEIDILTNILIRYTIGFGLLEVILKDQKVQDATINSPMGQIPIFLVHADFQDCRTNILPTPSEAEGWASKLRLISGRPLDEANPILDTEIDLPGTRARVGVITKPLDPSGTAFAFRRHRDKPWTLPLFIKNRFINPLSAGILSFLIDGSRTMLVAGTRSAGKTSLLGSLMVEIMRKYRIITVEDTLELPSTSLRKLGYNIQPMKVASALARGTTEVPADEGIRTTLRLGDSCLIVGEVRSTEAAALYEAMRVGALANVVAGTIHGDSPYGVFDRVVNDLKVPRTSFKATDIIVVANPIRSADGLHRWRRVTQITEVRKLWENDPLREGGFVDLMKYSSESDQLEPSNELINGDSDIIKSIAGNVKEWAGNWDAVWDNITLRAKVKEQMVKLAEKAKNMELLEAEFVVLANDQFHRISDQIKDEVGALDSSRIFFEWNEWLKAQIKKRKKKII